MIDELRMHYIDEGPKDSSVVVFLHGEPSWSYLYRDMTKCMVEQGYRVIVPDLVGFGKSDKLTNLSDYTYERQVNWTKTLLLDSLKLQNINLFVQDWGGLIGLRILTENTANFRKVAVANTALPTGDSIFVVGENFKQWQNVALNSPNFNIGDFIERGTFVDLTDAEVAAYNAPFPSEEFKKGARQMPQLVPTTPNDPASEANRKAWEVLSKLQLPFLTLYSDMNTVGQEFEKYFQDIVPGAKNQPHQLLKNGNHFLQEDNAPELCTILQKYFESDSVVNPDTTNVDSLLLYAKSFPPMPRNTADLIPFVGGLPTFSSGTPFSDLEFTAFDTDYIDGENSGGDVFYPVDPSDEFPGSDKVKLIRCVLNSDLDFNYMSSKKDRVILGTYESEHAYFTKGIDNIDNDYAVILQFDYKLGRIQLKGKPDDYKLIYGTTENGCQTTGWYLFSIKEATPDLIAFIFPCNDLEPSVSGNPPNNLLALCNEDKLLSLTDPVQFIYAKEKSENVSIENSILQFGGKGKEIVGGMTVDKDGNIYLMGLTDSNLDNKTDAENEIFISKIDTLGNVKWVTELAMKEGTFLKDGVCDDDYIYVCGRTLGNLPGFTNAGKWDGLILKLNLIDGSIIAMNQWGNQAIDGYGSIVLDDDGNLFVSAQGSPEGVTTPDDSYLVAKHRTSDLGNVWRVIEPTTAPGFSASAEAWGGLTYVKGIQAGNGRLIAAGWYIAQAGANAFISIYENLNALKPTRPHSITLNSPQGATADWILDNVVDSQGNLYFGGFTTGNFGSQPKGEGDAYIVKYSPTLSNPRFIQFGTSKSENIYKLSIDKDDNIYAVGYTYGDYAGKNADLSNETADIYVQKLDANLNLLDKIQFGTPYEERANAKLLGDRLYIGGITEGSLAGKSHGTFDGYALALNTKDLSFVKFNTPTSVSQVDEWKVGIHPNPASKEINVKLPSEENYNYKIFNQIGTSCQVGKIINQSINIETLHSGVYFLLINNIDNKTYSGRFIKVD
jgi:pimeloyl-ACP methyl ester carboxylesterase